MSCQFVTSEALNCTMESTDQILNGSSNISSTEIDEETMKKLKGDTLGDTMYSESVVLKTLLQLADVKWDEKFESDLCLLWDMTLEKDTCDYLFLMSYPAIACEVINKYDENRLLEIVIGILGNICCYFDGSNISSDQIETVLAMLSSSDPLILIQVMRFLKGIFHESKELPFITEDIINKINFILSNSCNSELLICSLDNYSRIIEPYKVPETLITGESLNSCIVAYQTLYKKEGSNLDNSQIMGGLNRLMQITCHVCCYIDLQQSERLYNDAVIHADTLTNDFNKYLDYYSLVENLLPIPEDFQYYIEILIMFFEAFSVKYRKEVFLNIVKIIKILVDNDSQELSDVYKIFLYFIKLDVLEDITNDLKTFNEKDIKTVLKVVHDLKVESCEEDFSTFELLMKNFNVIK